jgi:hypothetical protein
MLQRLRLVVIMHGSRAPGCLSRRTLPPLHLDVCGPLKEPLWGTRETTGPRDQGMRPRVQRGFQCAISSGTGDLCNNL